MTESEKATNLKIGIEKIRGLHKTDEVDSFDCGKESSNDFLKNRSFDAQASGSAKIFIISRGNRVLGYYSLSSSSICTKIASFRSAKGQPSNGKIPVVLLGQLAVDKNEQGKNIGKMLLKDAIYRTLKSSDDIGIRAMLVHAIDDNAKSFYKKFGFEDCPASDLTLMLLMKDAKEIFK